MNSKRRQKSPTGDVSGRHAPPMAAMGGKVSAVTTKEAVELFKDAGFPRSLRTVERYCKKRKVEAFLDPDEDTYYIDRESIDTLIEHFREIQERHLNIAPTPDDRKVPTSGDSGGHAPPSAATGGKVAELEEELEKAQEETLKYRIDAGARQGVINALVKQIRDDRGHYTSLLEASSRREGALEAKLLRLEGNVDTKEAEDPEE